MLTPDQLSALIERFAPERAAGKTLEEAGEAQVQLLLARIAALTDLLQDAAPTDTARLASRVLLSDLSAVAAHYRGRANSIRSPLAKALDDLRTTLARQP